MRRELISQSECRLNSLKEYITIIVIYDRRKEKIVVDSTIYDIAILFIIILQYFE